MKKILFTILTVLFVQGFSHAQTTATDFTANDCVGSVHNLFSELDAGKIIVIAWVMPCGSCAPPAIAAYNAVQSYASSNPNRVYFYLVDDYANTSCATLTSWGNNNSMLNAVKFSDAEISMTKYGTAGMPKIIVLGGTNHTVAYNQNSGVTTTDVQQAINSLFSADIPELSHESSFRLSVFPNPVSDKLTVNFTLLEYSTVTIQLIGTDGKIIQNSVLKDISSGNYTEQILFENELKNGIYLLQLKTEKFTESIKFIVEK
jgi:hypothetical protein